jgi:hypothetical protein
MSEDIRIEDLAQPQLDAAQRAALAWGETQPVELTAAAVLAAAQARTGLQDFGAADFHERLELLCSEWDGDRALTAMHRAVLFGYLARYAANRLLIQDTLRRHPQILGERIDRPVIVTGLPRSGTTHLVNLLAADARFHSLPLWESYEPVPLPSEAALPDGTDPRYARCAAAWEAMRRVTPLLASMHPMEPDHIHEELELMGPDFASYNFEWLSMSPRWRDHYLGTDFRPRTTSTSNRCCSCCSGSGGKAASAGCSSARSTWSSCRCYSRCFRMPPWYSRTAIRLPSSSPPSPCRPIPSACSARGWKSPGCATIGWRASRACCAPVYAIASWQGRRAASTATSTCSCAIRGRSSKKCTPRQRCR